MGKCSLIILVLLALGSFAAAQAQDGSSILQHANSAMGCSAVGSNTSITVSGSLKSVQSGAEMRVVMHSQGLDRWRSELDTPKEHKVTVVNGGKGQIQHQDGRITPLAEHNTQHQRATHIPCLSRLNSPLAEINAAYLRSEPAGNDILDVLELSPTAPSGMPKVLADRTKTTVWISRATGYVVRLRYINAAERGFNAVEPVDVIYTDYRVVNGMAVPFQQETLSGGQVVLELTLDSVHLNSSTADFTLR